MTAKLGAPGPKAFAVMRVIGDNPGQADCELVVRIVPMSKPAGQQALKRLNDLGLVYSESRPGPYGYKAPRRKYFTLTPAGARSLDAFEDRQAGGRSGWSASKTVKAALRTQPVSVFDLARVGASACRAVSHLR